MRLLSLIPKNVVHYTRRLADFDHLHGTDTTMPMWGASLGVSSDYAEFGYEPTPVRSFRRALKLADFPCENATFIDLGAGKGRTLLLASRLSFTHIVGVEFSPQLCAIARRNIATFRGFGQRCKSIEVACCDAALYDWPDGPLVVYMYNPFSAELLRTIMSRLRQSLERSPRPISLIYFNPVQRDVLDAMPWLKLKVSRQFSSPITQRQLCRVAIYQAA